MNPLPALDQRARAVAGRDSLAIDTAAYEDAGRDPLQPLLWGGAPNAAVAFFGRDPGRDEVRWMEPLIGASGRLVRDGVHQAIFGRPTADFEERRGVSRLVFFSNTVPYKPVGNKPWPEVVVERFRPFIAEVLADIWTGEHLITLGNDAFLWFGDAAAAHWAREDRYERPLVVGWPRRITLHALPHPSPANARWHTKFPGMLAARLAEIGMGAGPEGAAAG